MNNNETLQNRKYKFRSNSQKTELRLIDKSKAIGLETDVEVDVNNSVVGNKKANGCKNSNPIYLGNFMTDPSGSYTGRPRDLTETPVQDADDL